MKEIGNGVKKIFREDRKLLAGMCLMLILGIILILYTLIHFKTSGTTRYVGYSDIGEFSGGDWLSLWNSGGYRIGGWAEMSVFPILGLTIGVLHNLFAARLYMRRGNGFVYILIILSISVELIALVLLIRLLGNL